VGYYADTVARRRFLITWAFEPLGQRRVIRRGLTRAMFIFVDTDDFAYWDNFAAA
jgi:hypothetical protein